MKTPERPVYLARESYRRRRTMDAARLLPVLGVFLFLLPRLWTTGGPTGGATASEGLYVFGVWAGLILAAVVLARRLAPGPEGEDTPGAGPGPE